MTRKNRIQEGLHGALSPTHLQIIDETNQHAVSPQGESHFKVIVVSENFAGQSLIARHRIVNRTIEREFSSGLHALAIHAWTPDEWTAKGNQIPKSPPCRGGSKATSQ